jgi:NitT/TauT family transport system substrate-binding protein
VEAEVVRHDVRLHVLHGILRGDLGWAFEQRLAGRGRIDAAAGILLGGTKMRNVLGLCTALATTCCLIATTAVEAQTNVRVGWCARTISSAAAPYAIASRMGWFDKLGVKVDLVPLPGAGECSKFVATGDLLFALPSVEPVPLMRAQGAKLKVFYTAYQANIYGLAVPADSPIKSMADTKGKRIGVIGMSSGAAIVARALAKESGLDPDKDISIVVAGEASQTAALIRNGSVDALSQFDTQYALIENAGVKLRRLSHPTIEKFPANGFIALEETLIKNKKEAIAVTQGYAMGTLFALTNPEAAVRLLWEHWPQTKSTSKDEATALAHDVSTLNARTVSMRLESVGAKRWGEGVVANYQAYMDWLLANGVIKEKVSAGEILDNSLIDEINKFDSAAVIKAAKEWKPK